MIAAARLSSAHRVVTPQPAEYGGFAHRLHRFAYGAALERRDFCGGNRPEARWLTRDDILAALAHFGYARVHPFYEEPAHPHGPAFAIAAAR